MRALTTGPARPAIGIAYSRYVPQFLERHPDSFDYVEVPFELLRHDPAVATEMSVPVVLHCATLSIGGTIACNPADVQEILRWVAATRSPWLGEHLAFVTAARPTFGDARSEPYNIGYTVSPPMNREVLERVVGRLTEYERVFPVPLLIENSPLYFEIPGSTMTQAEFMAEVCARTRARLLLDLTHFYISSKTLRFDPIDALDRLPLHSVVEVHISGVESTNGDLWDDHASVAPNIVYEMLDRVLDRTTPQAVTLEYNWPRRFHEALLLTQLERTHKALDRAAARNARRAS